MPRSFNFLNPPFLSFHLKDSVLALIQQPPIMARFAGLARLTYWRSFYEIARPKKKWFHSDRTSCGHCHHRDSCVYASACVKQSQDQSVFSELPQQPSATFSSLEHVSR